MPRFGLKRKKKAKEPESFEKAYEYAVFLLSLHLRTIGEILKKMRDKGYAPETVEKVIEQLKQQRFLDDRRYAEIFLENLKMYRNFGYYGIRKKMLEKKLPLELIDGVLEVGLQPEEETKIARRLLKKEGFAVKPPADDEGLRYSTFGEESRSKEKAKMANRMRSRGFRGEVIARLVF